MNTQRTSHKRFKYCVIFGHDEFQSDFDLWANSEGDAYRIAMKILDKHNIKGKVLMVLPYTD